MAFDTVFRAARVLIDGAFRSADVGVRDGVVTHIGEIGTGRDAESLVELRDGEVYLAGRTDEHSSPPPTVAQRLERGAAAEKETSQR